MNNLKITYIFKLRFKIRLIKSWLVKNKWKLSKVSIVVIITLEMITAKKIIRTQWLLHNKILWIEKVLHKYLKRKWMNWSKLQNIKSNLAMIGQIEPMIKSVIFLTRIGRFLTKSLNKIPKKLTGIPKPKLRTAEKLLIRVKMFVNHQNKIKMYAVKRYLSVIYHIKLLGVLLKILWSKLVMSFEQISFWPMKEIAEEWGRYLY